LRALEKENLLKRVEIRRLGFKPEKSERRVDGRKKRKREKGRKGQEELFGYLVTRVGFRFSRGYASKDRWKSKGNATDLTDVALEIDRYVVRLAAVHGEIAEFARKLATAARTNNAARRWFITA